MAFTKTIVVRKVGNSKVAYIPNEWGVEKGDMINMICVLKGREWLTTTKAHRNSSCYLTVPAMWPCSVGDLIDIKIAYANVPKKVKYDEPGESDGDTGTED